ncbi:MAG: sigma-54 dependent transcriptional regulator [Acidobacteria bacterium]|jgi:DNA-binding NtrC family response regulator|nr:sigma-54 dependent transcriptional regulator [Acidobacteriota bacterium]
MDTAKKILIVEDDPAVVITLTAALEAEGYTVAEAHSAEQAMERLDGEDFPVVLTDIYMERKTGLDVLHRARALNPSCSVILMTGKGSLETVIESTRGGAFEYLSKPFSVERLLETVRGALRAALAPEPEPAPADDTIRGPMIGNSPAMIEVYKFISRLAPTEATVLLCGETGTGKELVAKLIHQNGPRARARLVVIDCAALKDTLVETELFGAVRGAYTGADRDRSGLLEVAAGGTVFLDEIGEIDTPIQLRLLRFLEEKEIRPVGSTASRKVDVRVIAASNKELGALVGKGLFREDLWYRLNVASLEIPPLRRRREDIPRLVEHFLREFTKAYGRPVRLENGALRLLLEHAWPGNVRQLRHVLEKLVILTPGGVVDAGAVGAALDAYVLAGAASAAPSSKSLTDLSALEEEHIRKVLEATAGNKSRAAAILGIERKTLYRKLERMEAARK